MRELMTKRRLYMVFHLYFIPLAQVENLKSQLHSEFS
jgi:hypothetical protein